VYDFIKNKYDVDSGRCGYLQRQWAYQTSEHLDSTSRLHGYVHCVSLSPEPWHHSIQSIQLTLIIIMITTTH